MDYLLNKIKKKARRYFRRYRLFLWSLFALLPLNDTLVVFAISLRGGMENFQTIYDALKKHNGIQVRVLRRDGSTYSNFKALYFLSRAKVILIDNHYDLLFEVTPRIDQEIIQIWHAGGAFKKFGLAMPRCCKSAFEFNRQAKEHSSYTHCIVSSQAVIPIYAEAFGIPDTKILDFGLPKIDQLYRLREDSDGVKERFYKKYPEAQDKLLVLYAPTFRDVWDEKFSLQAQTPFSINEFCERFSDTYCLALRAHFNCFANGAVSFKGCIDVTAYDEFELLACCDILITDYSSIIFNFAFFRKPIIFFPYDFTEYIKERGFYSPYENFVPGEIVYTPDELYSLLETPLQYNEKINYLWDTYMSSCDGHSTERLKQFILNRCSM